MPPINHIPVLAEPGELVIPREIAADLIPQLQKALTKVNDDMEKYPGVNGLDFRQFMVGSPEAKRDKSGMQMFPLGLDSPMGPDPGDSPADPFGGSDPNPGGFSDTDPVNIINQLADQAAQKLLPQEEIFAQSDVGGQLVPVSELEGAEAAFANFSGTGALTGMLADKLDLGERRVSVGGLPGPVGDSFEFPAAAPATRPLGPTFTRPDLMDAPANFGFSGLDELQQRTRIATEGLHGSSLFRGDQARNIFKNLLQRSLINEQGGLGDLSSLLPVEQDYIRQVLGINAGSTQELLGAL